MQKQRDSFANGTHLHTKVDEIAYQSRRDW